MRGCDKHGGRRSKTRTGETGQRVGKWRRRPLKALLQEDTARLFPGLSRLFAIWPALTCSCNCTAMVNGCESSRSLVHARTEDWHLTYAYLLLYTHRHCHRRMYACMSRRCDAVGAFPDFGNSWCRSLSCFLRVLCVMAWRERGFDRAGNRGISCGFLFLLCFGLSFLSALLYCSSFLRRSSPLASLGRASHLHTCTRVHHSSMLTLNCT